MCITQKISGYDHDNTPFDRKQSCDSVKTGALCRGRLYRVPPAKVGCNAINNACLLTKRPLARAWVRDRLTRLLPGLGALAFGAVRGGFQRMKYLVECGEPSRLTTSTFFTPACDTNSSADLPVFVAEARIQQLTVSHPSSNIDILHPCMRHKFFSVAVDPVNLLSWLRKIQQVTVSHRGSQR